MVFSGPSGAGKGTILKRYFEDDTPAVLSVSATTRAPRPGEVDGVHYHFISRAEFEQLIANDGVLEYNIYNGNYYGTLKAEVEKRLEAKKVVVLVIDVHGAENIRRMFPGATTVFLLPPSVEELERRLRGRGTETEEKVRERLETAKRELPYAPQYDYQIVNGGDIEAAYQSLRDVFLKSTGEA